VIHDWLMFAVVLLALAVLLAVGTIIGMALMLLRPPRMTDGKAIYRLRRLSPGDLGLPFEDLTFNIRDEHGRPLRLAAWWIAGPHPRGRCIVLIHGYADAKVGAIAWGPLFHALGYNILAIDLRAHGESGGTYCTGAFFERDDLSQAIDQLRAARPHETKKLVLFGVSLGAAVAAAVAARRDDIAAVIMDSPYPDYRDAVDAHSVLLGQPQGLVQRLGVHFAEWLSGARFNAVRPVDLIRRIAAPLLIIQAGTDPFVPPADAAAVERAAASRPPERVTSYWPIPDAPHVQGLGVDPIAYRQRIEAFLGVALAAAPQSQGNVVQTKVV
jgi:pimeloyl-ACP methyl ester carboxylesterase